MKRTGVRFMDTPQVEKVDDGQGDPFYVVFTTPKQWKRYKRRSAIALWFGVVSFLLSMSLLFVTIPALSH